MSKCIFEDVCDKGWCRLYTFECVDLPQDAHNQNKEGKKMKWYHGTSQENWETIQKEGILFGRRFVTDSDGNTIKEVDRCTYLATDIEEAKHYGEIVLEVEYNPFDANGEVKKDKRKLPLNNYNSDSWQIRVYEPIPLSNIKELKTCKGISDYKNRL